MVTETVSDKSGETVFPLVVVLTLTLRPGIGHFCLFVAGRRGDFHRCIAEPSSDARIGIYGVRSP